MSIELTAKGLKYRRAGLSKRNYQLMGCPYQKPYPRLSMAVLRLYVFSIGETQH